MSEISKRFWRKVDQRDEPNACWPFLGYRDKDGYGIFAVSTKEHVRAPRFAYEYVFGPLAPGQHALHRCDFPPCCNPVHLFAGTHRENHIDKSRKGRHHQQKKTTCPKGHSYGAENTGRDSRGHRFCQQCMREYQRQYYLSHKLL